MTSIFEESRRGTPSSRRDRAAAVAALLSLAAWLGESRASAAEKARAIPPPAVDEAASAGTTPRSRCWPADASGASRACSSTSKGVTSAVSGYAGGERRTARLRDRRHRHDGPRGIGAGHLRSAPDQLWPHPADLFLGRARSDGAQSAGAGYRHAISLGDLSRRTRSRRDVAKAYIAQLDQARVFEEAIVTTIEPGRTFYPAEAYHQDFLTQNPTHPYIVINDLPKIDDLKRLFPGPLSRPIRCWWRRRRRTSRASC